MTTPAKQPSRWASLSASANAEADYQTVHEDPTTAHNSIYICPSIVEQINGNIELDAEESECDGGITCTCQKQASEPYDQPWIVSRAGYRKFFTQHHLHSYLRNPEFFGMYTFSDHYGYGQLEMMQNLLLDFVEAEPLWREQWNIVEGTVLWLLDEESTPILEIGTAHDLADIFNIIGRMFLAMLARLDRENLRDKVPSLGAVMSMYIELADRLRRIDVLEKEENIPGAFDYDVSRLASYIRAYSKEHSTALPSHKNLESYREERAKVELPAPTLNEKDPWGFFTAFTKYRIDHSYGMAYHYCGFVGIGRDALDITTWDGKKRSAKSFRNKDPLGKKDFKAIKCGLVLRIN